MFKFFVCVMSSKIIWIEFEKICGVPTSPNQQFLDD
jgi:hypothetical protein